MSASDRAALFTESGCETNNTKSAKERRAGCPKPKPGGTSGGCTFDGAMITLVPIVDSAHLVHGPIACAGNSWDSRGSLSSGPTLYKHGFTTDMTENDVVLGGEQRLFDTICEIVERYAPPAVFVYSTCVTAMIGDDLGAVCASAAEHTGVPVIPVEAPGFLGNKNLGNKIAGQALLDHVIGTVEPEDAGAFDINLIGEYNIAGELWDVLPVLNRLGLRLRACISGDARYRDVAAAHRAKATMVVCSRALLGLARGLEDRYGIPWFEGSFYGTSAMADTLRGFARLLDDDDLTRRTEELITVEEAATNAALEPYRARLTGRKAVLYTGGVKSWSIVSALQDLGIEVVGSGITKSSDGDVEKIRELLGDAKMIGEGSPRELLRVAEQTGADILVAGGRNLYTALKGRLPFLDINQERHIPYAGYTGMVEFARRLDMAISNPVWDQVRRPAPWDAQVAGTPGAPGTLVAGVA
ncbi:nitrogenase iron-molybdenum cofactor biosynthesis protein NifE [Frankia sp. Ag45/Mut15]|uniref:Nitrogenase iron-molybdenum cofactor biosynthesis protein NifE n=1 Tax=Frankia umida TaxID=573489 RepID=A0ABT0JTV7_9ACTN|nr:nitrogenase iron-molybdenum cofactor biosynthesis protein NifE [Frankia umida]MCK9874978.1 nitrogenase iron-molybdenum cofactor biosynthesis protein NifE [Frankia umida]